MADFAVRPPTEKDYPFILQSWVRTYTRSQRWGPLSPRAVAGAVHTSILELLKQPGVTIAIATNPTNPWFIFGYVVFSHDDAGPILHWVYVKDLYRDMGIGPDLVAHACGEAPGALRFTYKTPAAKKVLPSEATWSPQLARPRRTP